MLTAKRLRTPQELRDAADALKRAGYTKCDSCARYSNEAQRIAANDGDRDHWHRCPSCGNPMSAPVED